MALIVAPPREKNPYGSGIEELIKMYLMGSITGAMNAPAQQAASDKAMLMEHGGEFTPEQAGALEQQLNPKSGGFQGLIEKLISPKKKSIGFGQPATQQGPVELGMNAPAQNETPQTGQSFLQSLLQPTERGTLKFPSRIERETKAIEAKAQAEEAAKLAWRREEETAKSTRLAETIAGKQEYYDILDKHYNDLGQSYEARIQMAKDANESKERIAELNASLKEIQAKQKEIDKTRELDIKERSVAAREADIEKKGQATEKDNIKAFEDEAVAQGWLKVDQKTKAKTWKEFPTNTEAWKGLENLAKQYGYKTNWTERTDPTPFIGGKGWVPTIDYSTARSEKKTGVTPEKPKAVQKPRTQADVDALMKSANEAIKAGKDPEAIKKRLKEVYGIEIK